MSPNMVEARLGSCGTMVLSVENERERTIDRERPIVSMRERPIDI
jgi:hypothetical protein